jgi:hypothetical protein
MEYVAGREISERICSKGRFSEDEVALYPTYLIMLPGYLPYF